MEQVENIQAEGMTETQPGISPVEENKTEVANDNINTDAIETPDGNKEQLPSEDANVIAQKEQADKLAKLQEYELREQEISEMKRRIGIDNTLPKEISDMNLIESQLENQATQQWINLCNKYGVDYHEDKLDSSANALLESNPKMFYAFEAEAGKLSDEVTTKRQHITQQKNMYEISRAIEPHKTLINNSPVVSKVLNSYVNANINTMQDPVGEINNLFNDYLVPLYQEAFNLGMSASKSKDVASDKSNISGSVAGVSSNYDITGSTFTREQIRRMSSEEFARNEKSITKAMLEGRIS